MLENWVWMPTALARMSKHYKTSEPIPEVLLQSLLASRSAHAGITNIGWVVLASFDQAIHRVSNVDTATELARITMELQKTPVTPGTNKAASFGHLVGGYDAQYYSYLWSEVYSADMFASRFEAEGIFSPDVGMSYR